MSSFKAPAPEDSNYTFIEDYVRITAFPTESHKLTKHGLGDDLKKKDEQPKGSEHPFPDIGLTIKVNSVTQECIYF